MPPLLYSLRAWPGRHIIRPLTVLHALLRNAVYDVLRFARHASPGRVPRTRVQHAAMMTMFYHALEKSLSLPEPEPGHGRRHARQLLDLVDVYAARYGVDTVVASSQAALCAYADAQPGGALDAALLDRIRARNVAQHTAPGGGSILRHRSDILSRTGIDFGAFAACRHSVRSFTGEPVAPHAIEDAVRTAQRSPSVCNRQSCRVHVFENGAAAARILACQRGNTGFGHLASHILVVTSDLQHFFGMGERNQCWIDGGLFAMTLVYALHAQGLGTCCLNWSAEREQDLALRAAAGLPSAESVIMLLAVGHLPDTFRVAASPRKPLKDVLVMHGPEHNDTNTTSRGENT